MLTRAFVVSPVRCWPSPRRRLRLAQQRRRRLHPRRHAARQHHARARVVGRDVLRPARRGQPGGQHASAGWNGITYRVHRPAREMQIDLRCRSRSTAWCRTAGALTLPPRRQRVLRDARGAAAEGRDRGPSPSTTTAGRAWRSGRRGTAASSGRATPTAAPWIVDRRARGSAPASGGPTRTPRPTSPTASASRSPCPTRCSGRNGRLRGVTPARRRHDDLRVVRHQPDQQLRRRAYAGRLRALHRHLRRARAGRSRSTSGRSPAPRGGARDSCDAGASRCSQCFEHWFGPYPWYQDGYQLIEAPHLGMEHQSAVAYGNGYRNGYRGRDLSGTGWGLKWDFIIIHESAHEWWGNNITTARPRRHVGARELRQLLGVALHRVPVRQGGGRGVRARHPQAGQERPPDRRARTA